MRTPTAALRVSLLCLGLALGCASSMAQPSGRGVPTLTRYVQLFGQLERELADAHARHDAAALSKVVSPLFELRRNDATSVSMEDWAQRKTAASAAIEQLAVHEAGDQAIASFIQREPSGASTFIVDIWSTQPAGTWQLRLRFESPAPPGPPGPSRARRGPDGKG